MAIIDPWLLERVRELDREETQRMHSEALDELSRVREETVNRVMRETEERLRQETRAVTERYPWRSGEEIRAERVPDALEMAEIEEELSEDQLSDRQLSRLGINTNTQEEESEHEGRIVDINDLRFNDNLVNDIHAGTGITFATGRTHITTDDLTYRGVELDEYIADIVTQHIETATEPLESRIIELESAISILELEIRRLTEDDGQNES